MSPHPLSPPNNQDLGFSASDRAESVRRVGELACLMNDAGTITIVSLVSPYREDRDIARKRHEDQGLKFMEVFMDVPLDVVQDRDPKGLYKKVRWCGGGSVGVICTHTVIGSVGQSQIYSLPVV